ncbi:MAG: phage/plasmid primase, P4 family [Candidatus Kapabacteria bacterium]|nr:phage/plasmid primase, P4 family [Candidatus Kapabacteria bacterium]
MTSGIVTQAEALRKKGVTVIPIVANERKPAVKWRNISPDWQACRAAWQAGSADRLGIVHANGWLCIDIDGDKTSGNKIRGVTPAIAEALLRALNIPSDYAWAGTSQSGTGWHIWVIAPDADADGIKREIWHIATLGYQHDIELRYAGHYTALPTKGYTERMWERMPIACSIASIRNALHQIGAQRSKRSAEREGRQREGQRGMSPALQRPNRDHGKWKSTLDSMTKEIIAAPNGSRNNTLNKCAFRIGQLLAAQGGDEGEARQALTQAALQAGLEPREIAATIESGLRAGMRQPVHVISSTRPIVRPVENPETEQMRRLAEFPLTDSGNAEALVERVHGRFLFDSTNQCWRTFENGVWKEDYQHRIINEAKLTARLRYQAAETLDDPDEQAALRRWALQSENANRIRNAVLLAQTSSLSCVASDFDRNRDVVVTANGYLIHLPTGEARKALPEDMVTLQLGAPYVPEAKPARWLQALREIYGGDNELLAWLQRAIGYSLTGHTREQCVFLLYGNGANGKSLVLSVMRAVMGQYGEAAPFVLFDAEERINSDYLLAQLRGKRMITITESSEDRRLHEARLKSATGEDAISARNPYGRPFTYQPEYKIWLAMNYLPMIRGADAGIWRRLKLIEHRISFDTNRDVTLRDKLCTPDALAGILNWAIDGAILWYDAGLGENEAIRQATSSYREESDQIGRWLEDRCQIHPDIFVPSAVAYSDYHDWCDANGERPLSITAWGERLTRRGFPADRMYLPSGRRERIRKGFALLSK